MVKERSAEEINEYSEMANSVMKELFGKKSGKLQYKPAGQTNFVFEANLPDGDFIIRISTAKDKIESFKKEQWVLERVKKEGIPVAEIIEVGNEVVKMPYMVQKKIKGQDALYHPDKKKILQQMGEYNSIINKIHTNDFGKTFDWSDDDSSKNKTWEDFLKNEIEIESRLAILEKNKMVSAESLKKLSEYLQRINELNLQPVLNHGDMRRKNVLVNDKAEIVAIIDWEESCSSIAPAWDLSIALHDLAVDDKQFYLEGYGITSKEYREIFETIKAFNLINYAPIIKDLVKRKEKHHLEFYKLRLSGCFDLYSL